MSEEFPIPVQIGDKVFVNTHLNIKNPMSWLGWAIRKIAAVKYNHVRIVVEKEGVLGFIHAIEEGVIFEPLFYKPKRESICVKGNFYISNIKQYNADLLEQEGKKYDFINLLLIQLLWNGLHLWIGSRTEEKAKKRFICYELAFYADRQYLGFDWWTIKPSTYIKSTIFRTLYEDE